jgi:hypothetical protein
MRTYLYAGFQYTAMIDDSASRPITAEGPGALKSECRVEGNLCTPPPIAVSGSYGTRPLLQCDQY